MMPSIDSAIERAIALMAADGRSGAVVPNERKLVLFRPGIPPRPTPAVSFRGRRVQERPAHPGASYSAHRLPARCESGLAPSVTMIPNCIAAATALVLAILCLCAIREARGAAVVAENESPSYSEQMNSDLNNIRECNRTFPIGLAAMNAVLVHQRLTGVGDENFQCFLHCLYIKYGWMDDEGSFLLGVVRSALRGSDLPPSAAQWLLYRCTSTRASDPCERALDFTRCFWTEAQEVSTQAPSSAPTAAAAAAPARSRSLARPFDAVPAIKETPAASDFIFFT